MREVYRLNKQPLYDALKIHKIDVMFICLTSDELTYEEIEKSMLSLMKFLHSIEILNPQQ